MNRAEFIQSLRQERIHRGLTQRALAHEIGVTQPALAQWESRQRVPLDDLLRRWAAALGKPVPTGVHGVMTGPSECGTPAAYARHHYRGEMPCRPCRAAVAAKARERRATSRTAVDEGASR